MTSPETTETPLGKQTTYRFDWPYLKSDFARMQALLDDATIDGGYAMRFIYDDHMSITISTTEPQ